MCKFITLPSVTIVLKDLDMCMCVFVCVCVLVCVRVSVCLRMCVMCERVRVCACMFALDDECARKSKYKYCQ